MTTVTSHVTIVTSHVTMSALCCGTRDTLKYGFNRKLTMFIFQYISNWRAPYNGYSDTGALLVNGGNFIGIFGRCEPV